MTTSVRYPTEVIDIWQLHGGRRVIVRPILPQDDVPLGHLISRLSLESRRKRFHGGVSALPDTVLRKMTRVDFVTQVALIATVKDAAFGERIVADARFNADSLGESAELALMVDDPWQRLGIGSRLVTIITRIAAQHGLKRLHGSVLKYNVDTLTFAERCGFECNGDPADWKLMAVEMALSAEFASEHLNERPWASSGASGRRTQEAAGV